MQFNKNILKDYFLRLSLNQKLVAMMLLLSLSIITIFVVLYSRTEQAIFKEFEARSTELSKAIQIAVEEVTSSGSPDVKRLENYLKKLNAKGVKEISVISNSDKIISSTGTTGAAGATVREARQAPPERWAPRARQAPPERRAPRARQAPPERRAPRARQAPPERRAPRARQAPPERWAPPAHRARPERQAPRAPQALPGHQVPPGRAPRHVAPAPLTARPCEPDRCRPPRSPTCPAWRRAGGIRAFCSRSTT